MEWFTNVEAASDDIVPTIAIDIPHGDGNLIQGTGRDFPSCEILLAVIFEPDDGGGVVAVGIVQRRFHVLRFLLVKHNQTYPFHE